MAYTKTNLNETTETVAVDMTAEDIENNETTETVAEQNARSYSKTVWNESTPITADKLNKIENGIASALPLSGGALTGSITVPGESKFHNGAYTDPWHGEICSIKASGNVGIGGALKVNGNIGVGGRVYSPIFEASTDFVVNRYGFITYYTNNQEGSVIHCEKNNSSINLKDNKMVYTNPHGNLEIGPQNSFHCHIYTDRETFYFNKDLLVKGNNVWHTGNFNPNGKLDAGAFTIHDRDLRIHGKRAMVGFNTADGNYLEINYDRDFAAGVRIKGLLGTDSIKSHGNLAFSSIGTGGGLNANIHNLTLHDHTGNGQMMTAEHNRIYVGNPQTPLTLESNIGIVANINGTQQRVLTDRDQCARFSWTGSRISIDGGGNNAAVSLADTSETTHSLYNWHGGGNCRLRTAGGLGPLDGYITMTW